MIQWLVSTYKDITKDISRSLGLNLPITFQDFRRGGVAWAFQYGVPLENIIKHRTWKLDAIWAYFSSDVTAVSPVALAFQQALRP